MQKQSTSFDAITLEVLWTRMISAVDEAAKALRRTSFSTLVNESNDFACVVTDADGCSLAQNTESIPSFIGTLPVTVKAFISEIGKDNRQPSLSADIFEPDQRYGGKRSESGLGRGYHLYPG